MALATGQVWLATGNDLGGSLRTPAGFNRVGVRPSPGRVPRGERLQAFDTLWVEGPMARSVEDAALMLDAGCRATLMIRSLSIPMDTVSPKLSIWGRYRNELRLDRDLGVVPMASEVADVCQQSVLAVRAIGN